jgi:hypothetical protein
MFNNYIDGLAPSLLLIKNHFMVISKPYKVVLRDNGELSLLGYLKDPINSWDEINNSFMSAVWTTL